MKFDWESPRTEILWNPRAPAELREKWEPLLNEASEQRGLSGHFWLSTSGTSGLAKWVALSKRAVLISAESVNRFLASGSGDCWLHALPSFHVGGLGIWARSALSGARVIDLGSPFPKWDPQRFACAAEQSGATLSALVPAQVHDLVTLGLRAPRALRAIVVGGGNLSDSLAQRARNLGWRLLPSYGMTECCSQIATASLASIDGPGGSDGAKAGDPNESSDPSFLAALEVLSHVQVRVDSSSGLLELRSEALLSGYLRETLQGVEFQDPRVDGWFTTEDQGEVLDSIKGTREVTLLRVRGRRGSFLKMGGESVDFARLERLFEEIWYSEAGIDHNAGDQGDAALIALPDERMGYVTCLVISGREDRELAKKIELLNGRVLPVERIRTTVRVEAIPRSPLGKLLKQELIQELGLSRVIERF